MQKYKSFEEVAFLTTHLIGEIAMTLSLANVVRNLNPEQVKVITRMIIQEPEFKSIKPSEICFYIENGVSGKYGKLYEGIGVDKIYGWIRAGWNERFEEIENYRQKENSMLRAESSKPLAALLGVKDILKPKEEIKPEPTPREKQEYEIKSDVFLAEFEQLVDQGKAEVIQSIPFVDYQGKKMNKQEYHNARWVEVYPLS